MRTRQPIDSYFTQKDIQEATWYRGRSENTILTCSDVELHQARACDGESALIYAYFLQADGHSRSRWLFRVIPQACGEALWHWALQEPASPPIRATCSYRGWWPLSGHESCATAECLELRATQMIPLCRATNLHVAKHNLETLPERSDGALIAVNLEEVKQHGSLTLVHADGSLDRQTHYQLIVKTGSDPCGLLTSERDVFVTYKHPQDERRLRTGKGSPVHHRYIKAIVTDAVPAISMHLR